MKSALFFGWTMHIGINSKGLKHADLLSIRGLWRPDAADVAHSIGSSILESFPDSRSTQNSCNAARTCVAHTNAGPAGVCFPSKCAGAFSCYC